MSYLSSLVLARAGEKEFPMLSSLSSPRIRAVVSLAGIALCLVGFFLPMFTESNPGVPGSAHPVYEWQVLTLPATNGRGFFLHPAHLLVFRRERRVEAVCPEAFPSEEDVSLCPRVQARAFARILSAAL